MVGLIGVLAVVSVSHVSSAAPVVDPTGSVFRITVRREVETPACTRGTMLVNGKELCKTLEKPWKENQKDISSIPPGSYGGLLRYDNTDHWRLELDKVPERTGIQIHIGNSPDDTKGCVLVGESYEPSGCAITAGMSAPAYKKLKQEFYGTDTPNASPDTKVVVEFLAPPPAATAAPTPDYSKADSSFVIDSERWPSSSRNPKVPVDRVVVHSSFAKAKPRTSWFGKDEIFRVWRDQKNAVGKPFISVHYFIDRAGKVHQLVPESEIANHAKGFNSRSIGIELAGIADDFVEDAKKGKATEEDFNYTAAQYDALSDLLIDIAKRKPGIKIIRHSDVEKDSGRKKDPGSKFDTAKLKAGAPTWVTEP